MAETFDVEIGEDGILEVIHREGQEPVERMLIPHVVTSFSIGAVDEGGDKALILVLRTQFADQTIVVALEPRTVKRLVLALFAALERELG